MNEATIKTEGVKTRVSLTCELDHHNAKRIREAIDKEVYEKRPRVLIIDFSGVDFMDSSGIGLILGRVNTAEKCGTVIELSGMQPHIAKLIRLSGVEKLERVKVMK